MVILYICKILKGIIQLLFLMVIVQVYLFIFQSVKIPFHWSVVIWTSCLTHALCDSFLLAEFSKSLWCILASLITMQYNIFVDRLLTVQSFLQNPDGKIACYMTICYTCNYTSIVEIYNSAIISYITSAKKQVYKVSRPADFLTWSTGLRQSFFVFVKHIKNKKIFYFSSLDISPPDFFIEN